MPDCERADTRIPTFWSRPFAIFVAQELPSNLREGLKAALPGPAVLLAAALAATAAVISAATELSFVHIPDLSLLFAAVLGLDAACRLVQRTEIVRAISLVLYSVLYLSLTCLAGILAAYATQRLSLPLRDDLFAAVDRALGIDWTGFVRWVDDCPTLAVTLRYAYDPMGVQVALPAVLLAFMGSDEDLRTYSLAFVIALTVTTVSAALLPAESAYASVDPTSFHNIRFSGHTPLSHLRQLRAEGPTEINSEALGGILSCPSFHAVVAVLTPLSLRRWKALFYPLLVLCSASIVGAVTEGGHYVIDVIVGAALAVAAQHAANAIVWFGRTDLSPRDCVDHRRLRPELWPFRWLRVNIAPRHCRTASYKGFLRPRRPSFLFEIKGKSVEWRMMTFSSGRACHASIPMAIPTPDR